MKKVPLMLFSMVLIFSVGVFGEEGEDIYVKGVIPFVYVALPFTGPFTEIPTVTRQLIMEIQNQNIVPSGPLIGVYYNSPKVVKSEELQWEMGFPVAKDTEVNPPLQLKEWIFTLVVTATYIGPYEETASLYPELFSWIEENNYQIVGPIIERYLDDPMSVKAEELRSEIWIPCEKK